MMPIFGVPILDCRIFTDSKSEFLRPVPRADRSIQMLIPLTILQREANLRT